MKISQILDKIDENQLFVPIFQREYVWKRKDAKKLIESLIKEYPTGTMLTWETNNPPKIKGPHQYSPEQWSIKIILDGQQRITTLYMLIRGDIPPYYSWEEIENDVRGLYVNLETLDLEYFSEKKMGTNPLWVNITDIFQKKVRVIPLLRELEKQWEVSNQLADLIDDNLKKVQSILDREFLEQTIPIKATIKEAIDIFYIVNASWVSLTEAELALAQISWYWPEARDLFKDKIDELEKEGFVFKLDFLVYAILWVLYFNGSDMSKLHSSDNYESLIKAWDLLSSKVLDYVCNIMRTHAFVDHTDEVNSIYALIPIIVYTFHKPDQTLTLKEISKIVKWFYYSQIRSRYVSQLPQKLDKDLSIVRNSDSPFDDLLLIIKEDRILKINEDEFVGVGVAHPLFWLMKRYFKSKKAVCLSTGLSLHRNMGKKYSLERDHIFAYSILKNSGYNMNNRHKYSLAQEITNRAILTQLANRTKLDQSADVYLKNIKDKNPEALKLQCIPDDENLWKLENFELFLQERRKILTSELNAFLEGLTETKEMAQEVDIMDLISEGESKYLEFKSSLRWDTRQGTENKALEQVVLKVISSFSNAEWGTLLIGVSDDWKVLGLQKDYELLKGGRDEFELHLTNIINNAFWSAFRATQINITFPNVDEQEICMIEIKSWWKPLFLKISDKNWQKQEKFFVRSWNSSQEFNSLEEINSYINKRFNS